jgi:prepilin-type processing-associated H-X9-DG protein
VVIGVIIVTTAILIPAIQKVREAANRLSCSNHLREIGIALHHHHNDHGLFPSNGGHLFTQYINDVNGRPTEPTEVFTQYDYEPARFYWGVGDPSRAPRKQPGSWAYAILPYIEAQGIYQQRSWTVPVTLYVCPSRRPAIALPANNDTYGIYNGGGWSWGKTDYASNMRIISNGGRGCRRIADILDGPSNTILIGEKALHPSLYTTGSWYWDEPFFVGGTGGTKRFQPFVIRDGTLPFEDKWGSPHSVGANFLFGDGSVRTIRHGSPQPLVMALMTPRGGEIVPQEFDM